MVEDMMIEMSNSCLQNQADKSALRFVLDMILYAEFDNDPGNDTMYDLSNYLTNQQT
jgi:hypothetical protein